MNSLLRGKTKTKRGGLCPYEKAITSLPICCRIGSNKVSTVKNMNWILYP